MDNHNFSYGEGTMLPEAVYAYPEDLLHAFRHNQPATDVAKDAAVILEEEMEEALAGIQTRQSNISEQILQLQLQQSALAAEHAAHSAALILCRKVHAPIRHLSFDVLAEIAWHCTPDFVPRQRIKTSGSSDASAKAKKSMTRTFPFVFIHVCSAWRTAALSSPRIWATLRLTIDRTDSSISMKNRTEIVTEWFARAKQLPLSLFIIIDDCVYSPSMYAFAGHYPRLEGLESPWGCFLTSLAPFMPRFRKLSIKANTTECLLPILEHPVTWDLRNLQSLQIQSYSYNDFSDGIDPERKGSEGHLFSAAPVLTHLKLNCMLVTRAELGQSLPWAQLTHLHILTGISVLDWVAVMELCPFLKTGIFGLHSDVSIPTNFPLPLSSSTHDELESLSVHLPGHLPYEYSLLELLHVFILPSLKYLDASREISIDKQTWTEAPHSDVRTYMSLERLSFCDDRSDCLPILLKETPNLCELSVASHTTFPATLFKAMTYTPRRDFYLNLNILPNLDTLILAFEERISPRNLKILEKMLLSRTNETIPVGCRPLKELTFLVRKHKVKVIHDLEVWLGERSFNGVTVKTTLERREVHWWDILPKYAVI